MKNVRCFCSLRAQVIHEPEKTYARTCVVCENMIYAGRPSLLFWDKPKASTSCNQDGQQTKSRETACGRPNSSISKTHAHAKGENGVTNLENATVSVLQHSRVDEPDLEEPLCHTTKREAT